MKKVLLLCACWPFCVEAQEVQPVLSPDYQALIRADSGVAFKNKLLDTTHDMRRATLRYSASRFTSLRIRKIDVSNNKEVTFIPAKERSLLLGGNATIIMGIQQPGRVPATQNEYVQGRSSGGRLRWQGAETGDPFSFGPSIHSLVFDGSNYIYDVNGRLIPAADAGDADYKKAAPYNNGILRTGAYTSNSVTLFTRYRSSYKNIITTSLRAGQTKEQTIVRGNNNRMNNLAVTLDGRLNRLIISGNYSLRQEKADHSNRAGFLNRVYQNSLITPVSFSNKQGSRVNGIQRSYNPLADNPSFLLNDEGHAFRQKQQVFSYSADYRNRKVRIKLTQGADIRSEFANEGYPAGSSGFPAGIAFSRNATFRSYTINPLASYDFNFGRDAGYRGMFSLNYIFNKSTASIHYPFSHTDYRYKRVRHELSSGVSAYFYERKHNAWLQLSNNIYLSGTSNRNNFFLPSVSGFFQKNELFGTPRFWAKVNASFNRYNGELPLSSSFAGYSLLRYQTSEVRHYLPADEAIRYNNIDPIRYNEFNTGIELSYNNRYRLNVSWYLKQTRDDVIPLATSTGAFALENLAAHRNKGLEIQLSNDPWLFKTRKYGLANTISFVRNRSKVTDVKYGYNNMPVAGFKDVYKTLSTGQPLGVITGSRWLRNSNGDKIIGTDGFPLVDPTPGIIGDPTPDFTIKLNQHFSFKERWFLSIDWQWNKGGDVWNGTAAMLDYLGRSATSAEQRGITNYVFTGVQVSGGHNTIPVSFYDPAKPVEQNRWVRYGASGVAESYIQPADCIRIQNISITYKPLMRKKIRELSFSLNAGNIMLWSAYKGADPEQLLFNNPGNTGLDFFNLPSVRSFSISSSIQF